MKMQYFKLVIFILYFNIFAVIQARADISSNYEYDDLYRLTKVTRSDGTTIEYKYDNSGNRTKKIVTVAAINGTCGSANGQTLTLVPVSPALCGAGTETAVSGTGPWTWSCNGLYNGTNTDCGASIQTWTITASAGTGGGITPQGGVTVASGSSKDFSVDATGGYTISDLKVDGASQALATIYPLTHTGYSFTNVTGNHTISATFSQIPAMVLGVCGSSNGGVFASAPTLNLCSVGTPTTVTGNGPWNWTCTGSGGGSPGLCTASFATTSVPQITVFSIPATSVSLTVPVTTLSATDTSRYLLTETASSPATTASGWNSVKPVSYTFATAGVKTLYAWGKSSSGVVSAGVSANVTIDISGPTLQVSTLPDGATTKNATLNISGSVFDTGGVTNLIVNSGSVVIDASGYFSTSVMLQPGTNTMNITAVDSLGNMTVNNRTITLDALNSAAPALTVYNPSDNSKTSQMLSIVNGTINANTTVEIKVNNGATQNASITGNAYSATVPLDSGLNTITITAKDLTGNKSNIVRTVTYDNTIPSLAITNPNQDITTTQNSITISGTISDTTSSTILSISLNGQTLTPQENSGTFSQLLTFPNEGTWPVVVTATDNVGNRVSASRNIIYSIPDNGSCGTSNNAFLSAAPLNYLCNNGTASTVTGNGPWIWNCSGKNGGTTASCSANIVSSSTTHFTVIPTFGIGFTITPATPQTINKNAATTVNVSPTSGYGIVSVTGCGGSLSGSTYTTGLITANCTISVTAVARSASNGSTSGPNISDALKVLQAIVGITPSLTATEKICYDVAPLGNNNRPLGNGILDAADVILILRRSIGIGSW
jgi:YD repeat-containing protein